MQSEQWERPVRLVYTDICDLMSVYEHIRVATFQRVSLQLRLPWHVCALHSGFDDVTYFECLYVTASILGCMHGCIEAESILAILCRTPHFSATRRVASVRPGFVAFSLCGNAMLRSVSTSNTGRSSLGRDRSTDLVTGAAVADLRKCMLEHERLLRLSEMCSGACMARSAQTCQLRAACSNLGVSAPCFIAMKVALESPAHMHHTYSTKALRMMCFDAR